MTSYNAILTLTREHDGAALADVVHDGELADYHAATAVDHRGRAQIIITIEAATLPQAVTTARVILAGHFDDQERLEVMTTDEYDRGDVPIPELYTVSEAASQLGVSRQAVQRRINRGTLPARQVGKHWAIPAQSLT